MVCQAVHRPAKAAWRAETSAALLLKALAAEAVLVTSCSSAVHASAVQGWAGQNFRNAYATEAHSPNARFVESGLARKEVQAGTQQALQTWI